MEISREVFEAQRRPRFGTVNPERMQLAFWEWMIRGDESPPDPREGRVLSAMGQMMRGGVLKSRNGPHRSRDLFNVPPDREDGPIWTFDRMGSTQNELPDGRIICVGGEHEDHYDPDFCIYNDVIVLGLNAEIEIYGYPQGVFPPTDFHSATLVEDRIIIVGCLGLPKDRQPGHTPVYALETSGYSISEVKTVGESPGWLSRHQSQLDNAGTLTIRSGEVLVEQNGKQIFWRNFEDYSFDVHSGQWHQLTHRCWRQYRIHMEPFGLFVTKHDPPLDAIAPKGAKHTLVCPWADQIAKMKPGDPWPSRQWPSARVTVDGVSVALNVGVSEIEVIVEGDLPDALAIGLAEEIRANTEAAIRHRCILSEKRGDC